jgi:hypothetical protein
MAACLPPELPLMIAIEAQDRFNRRDAENTERETMFVLCVLCVSVVKISESL